METTQPTPVQQTKTRVSLNPINHLITGTKNIFKTNFMTLLVITVVNVVVNTLIALIFVGVLLSSFGSMLSPLGGASFIGTLGALIVFAIIAAVVGGYFGLVTDKPILDGARKEKTEVAAAFKFALQRLPIAILTYLMLIILFLAVYLVIGLVSVAIPPLGILLLIAALIAGVLFFLRVVVIPFVLVDTEKPASPVAAVKQCLAIWKVAAGAICIYIVSLLAVAIILSIALGGYSNTSYTPSYSDTNTYETYNFNEEQRDVLFPSEPVTGPEIKKSTGFATALGAAALGYLIIQALITTLVTIISYAGLANVYVQARQLLDKKQGSPSTSGPTPMGPVAPVAEQTSEVTAPAPVVQEPTPPEAPTPPQTPTQ